MDQNNNQQQTTQQPQYTYQQPQQPVYQQPYQQNYNFSATVSTAQRGKGGGWIGFMRIMAWVMFGLIELVVVIGGFGMLIESFNSYWGFSAGTFFAGLGVLVGGTLLAFVAVAGTMILLDAAKNLQRLTTTTAELAEKVESIEKKVK